MDIRREEMNGEKKMEEVYERPRIFTTEGTPVSLASLRGPEHPTTVIVGSPGYKPSPVVRGPDGLPLDPRELRGPF
jgi:hypothetical protein